jgi:hypothetical protein
MLAVVKRWLPGSTRSGEKARKKSAPITSPRDSSPGLDHLFRRPRIGGALEHHELPLMQVREEVLERR